MTADSPGCDVLLGQSYYLRFDQKLWQAMQPFPPLGTLYAASLLRAHGFSLALFDAMLSNGEVEWQQALETHRPRYAVLFEDNFNYLSKMCLLRMRQAAFTMLAMARSTGCVVIAGGADASDHPDLYLEHGADYVLIGEGDMTLVELIDRLDGGSPHGLDDVRGLAWLEPGGGASTTTLRLSAPRPDLQDLDALPFPAWDLVDLERYRQVWLERHGYFALSMVTTRGCPFHCNWCAKPIWGQRYHVRSPENVVAEIEWLSTHFGPDYIWFMDDIFGLKPGWIEGFAALLSSRAVRIPFKCLSRVDLLLREGEIQYLKTAGADIVWVGAESGSQKILDAMQKGTSVEQIHQAARQLHQAGLRVGFFLQFGYPGETRQDIEKTLQMVRDCLPDDIGMSVSYPLPGTAFFRAVRDQLGARQNWYDSDDLAMLYRGPFSTEFYRQLHIVLHREFRLRKTQNSLSSVSTSGGLPVVRANGRIRLLVAWLYLQLRLPVDRWSLNRLAWKSQAGLLPLEGFLPPSEAAQPAPQVD